jgi:hypothetical protein
MNVHSKFELSRHERSVLWAVINGAAINGGRAAKDAISSLIERGLIVKTPETTPMLRATDKGKELLA